MTRKRESAVPLQLQVERWERLPWTQRIECPESGLTPARRLSDEVLDNDDGPAVEVALCF